MADSRNSFSTIGAPRRFDYGWAIVSACLAIGVVGFGVQYSFGVFFKPLGEEFGWSRAATAAIFSVFTVLAPFFGIAGGWLLDRYGPRMVIAMTGVFTGLGLLLTSWVTTPWHVFITYSLLIAMGTGPHFPVLMSTTSGWFIKGRGLAMGLVTAAIGLGMTVMAPAAGYLINAYGWRVAYQVISIVAFVVIIPLSFLLKRAPAFNVPHLSEKSAPAAGQSRDYTLKQALRHRNFWLITFMWLVCAGTLGLIITHIVSHAIDMGFASSGAVLIVSTLGIMSVVGKVAMGRASDSIGRRRALIAAGALMSLAMAFLLIASDLWMLYVFAIIFGLGYGGYASSSTALIGDTFGVRHLGLIMSVIILGWGTGSAAGPAMAGYIFDISGTYFSAFAIALAAALLAMLMSFFLKQPEH